MRRTLLTAAVAAAVLPGAALVPAGAKPKAGPVVAPAYDLFQTDPDGTHYGALHFRGVKGCAQFPEAANTDTVVQRKDAATPESPVTRIQARCLQLQGAFLEPGDATGIFAPAPGGRVRVGAATLAVDEVFVTLQSDRGRHVSDAAVQAAWPGKPSLGNVHFTFGESGCGGTFDSDLKVYFDVRAGSIDGPVVYSADDTVAPLFHSWDTPWGCAAERNQGGFTDEARTFCVPASVPEVGGTCASGDEHQVGAPADLLPGVNYLVNGVDRSGDFFPMQVPA